MPMIVEYRNGVQSSTISYSNMVIREGITNNVEKSYVDKLDARQPRDFSLFNT